jgi:hypothetical protein
MSTSKRRTDTINPVNSDVKESVEYYYDEKQKCHIKKRIIDGDIIIEEKIPQKEVNKLVPNNTFNIDKDFYKTSSTGVFNNTAEMIRQLNLNSVEDDPVISFHTHGSDDNIKTHKDTSYYNTQSQHPSDEKLRDLPDQQLNNLINPKYNSTDLDRIVDPSEVKGVKYTYVLINNSSFNIYYLDSISSEIKTLKASSGLSNFPTDDSGSVDILYESKTETSRKEKIFSISISELNKYKEGIFVKEFGLLISISRERLGRAVLRNPMDYSYALKHAIYRNNKFNGFSIVANDPEGRIDKLYGYVFGRLVDFKVTNIKSKSPTLLIVSKSKNKPIHVINLDIDDIIHKGNCKVEIENDIGRKEYFFIGLNPNQLKLTYRKYFDSIITDKTVESIEEDVRYELESEYGNKIKALKKDIEAKKLKMQQLSSEIEKSELEIKKLSNDLYEKEIKYRKEIQELKLKNGELEEKLKIKIGVSGYQSKLNRDVLEYDAKVLEYDAKLKDLQFRYNQLKYEGEKLKSNSEQDKIKLELLKEKLKANEERKKLDREIHEKKLKIEDKHVEKASYSSDKAKSESITTGMKVAIAAIGVAAAGIAAYLKVNSGNNKILKTTNNITGNVFNSIKSAISRIFTKSKDVVSKTVSTVKSTVSSAIEKTTSFISDLCSSAWDFCTGWI